MAQEKIKAAAYLVLLLAATPVQADFDDGHALLEKWRAYQKYEQGSREAVTCLRTQYYLAYIAGVSDSLRGIAFELPAGVTLGQLATIVGEYLDANPGEWHLPAKILINRALKNMFPKKDVAP